MKHKFVLVMMICFLIVGCSSTDDPSDVTIDDFNDSSNETVSEYFEFTHGLEDASIQSFKYVGEPLLIDYKIDNSGNAAEFGIMVLINGMVQDYSVDGETTSMYQCSLDEDETAHFTIELEPNYGTIDNTYHLNFIVVFYPNKIIESIDEYGNYHNVSQTMTFPIYYNQTISSSGLEKLEYTTIQMTEEDKQNYLTETASGETIDTLETSCGFEFMQNNEKAENVLNSDSTFQVKLCGKQGNYSVLEFKDGSIKNIGEISLTDGYYSVIDRIIDDGTNYFMLLVPLDEGNDNGVSQSEKFIVQ